MRRHVCADRVDLRPHKLVEGRENGLSFNHPSLARAKSSDLETLEWATIMYGTESEGRSMARTIA